MSILPLEPCPTSKPVEPWKQNCDHSENEAQVRWDRDGISKYSSPPCSALLSNSSRMARTCPWSLIMSHSLWSVPFCDACENYNLHFRCSHIMIIPHAESVFNVILIHIVYLTIYMYTFDYNLIEVYSQRQIHPSWLYICKIHYIFTIGT